MTVNEVVAGVLRPLTIDDLKNILGRALLEPAFQQVLKSDSDTTLRTLGIQPSAGSKRFFERLHNESFSTASDTIVPDVSPRPPNIVFK